MVSISLEGACADLHEHGWSSERTDQLLVTRMEHADSKAVYAKVLPNGVSVAFEAS
jgi:hypothetical protein